MKVHNVIKLLLSTVKHIFKHNNIYESLNDFHAFIKLSVQTIQTINALSRFYLEHILNL